MFFFLGGLWSSSDSDDTAFFPLKNNNKIIIEYDSIGCGLKKVNKGHKGTFFLDHLIYKIFTQYLPFGSRATDLTLSNKVAPLERSGTGE